MNESNNTTKVHFFTLVLNGHPFIEQHISTFSTLPIDWHWHIIEGVASLAGDTGWSLPNGGHIPEGFHKNGLSIDGTSEYLNKLKQEFPKNITIYRKGDGEFWNGKLEMVNAPIKNLNQDCLLWEVDVDEFWTKEQILSCINLFFKHPDKFAAFFWCHYFVGPNLITLTRGGYGNDPGIEWLRVWRYHPGFFWASHEPPILVEKSTTGELSAIHQKGFLTHAETEAAGLVFHHFAYINIQQLQFKESYYGYKSATSNWNRLQMHQSFPIELSKFFTWVTDGTLVGHADRVGVKGYSAFIENSKNDAG